MTENNTYIIEFASITLRCTSDIFLAFFTEYYKTNLEHCFKGAPVYYCYICLSNST